MTFAAQSTTSRASSMKSDTGFLKLCYKIPTLGCLQREGASYE